ncbi:MAG TPA: DUF6334 family protein [Gemmata sp.]
MTRELQTALRRVAEGGFLLSVDAFNWRGDSTFVTAVRFWFNEYQVTFLADEELDQITAGCGPVAIEDEGEWVDLSARPVWSECVGALVGWAWCLINDRGYTDAMRIEFERPNRVGSRVVEFVVVASAFRFFEAKEF